MPKKRTLPTEALVNLRQRLNRLPTRSSDRKQLVLETAQLYGVSSDTVYRALRSFTRPKGLKRKDKGQPRKVLRSDLVRYCELIAALKLRTTNKKGRCLSTARAIELLENFGVETPEGLIRLPAGILTVSTVNRYLKQWGYGSETLSRQPPAVRFQASHSNECWHMDLSPSDLKQVEHPLWFEEGRGKPTLMLYSVVDDRSGVSYQEYRCVYGEDVEAALRFLFNAMTAKADEGNLQGIPDMLYLDNGPISKSLVFQNVMKYLDIEMLKHLPAGKDGRRVTARSKGKVERPFRTIKEAYETLYHFHKPKNEAEANLWLLHYLQQYNQRPHRSGQHSRIEDWREHIPSSGLREMCSWERFCTFAREPEQRKVGIDARLSVNGVEYEVDPMLAGESVLLWWGLFDTELYVEFNEQRFGPFLPVDGPIPLHKYRKHKKTVVDQRADKIAALADRLGLPRAAMEAHHDLGEIQPVEGNKKSIPKVAFSDPDPFQEFEYPTVVKAKLGIYQLLGKPLALLPKDDLSFIDDLVDRTLNKQEIQSQVRRYFKNK